MSAAFDEPDFGSREIKGRLVSAGTPWLLTALVFAIIYTGRV